jgi:hypothetical protein
MAQSSARIEMVISGTIPPGAWLHCEVEPHHLLTFHSFNSGAQVKTMSAPRRRLRGPS